jgi:outer membrane receptor protein involved in Fe transport
MRLTVAAAVACLIGGIGIADEAHAALRRPINIPAQNLGTALQMLARERELQVVYFSGSVDSLDTPGAIGDLTVDEVLSRLLSGSGLVYRYLDDKTVTIVPAGAASAVAPGMPTPTRPSAAEPTSRSDSAPAPSGAVKDPQLSEVVVTGTHIRGLAPDSSPVTIFDRTEIERSGVATVAQFVSKLPQNAAQIDSGTFLSNGQSGAALSNNTRGAAVNLRGIGAGATLVLLNGHRLAPAGDDGSFVDISMIPLTAVERIEMLTDGASAIYGADAIGGVVNFVMRKDFSGAETALRYGDSSGGGAQERSVSQLLGTSWNGGNVMLSYELYEQDALAATQRSFVPAQNGPMDLLPEQKRNSVLFSVRHEFESGTDVFADGYFSHRHFDQTYSYSTFPLTIAEHGYADGGGGSLGIGHALWGDWRGEIAGNLGKTSEHRAGAYPGVTFDFSTESALYSAEARADGSVTEIAGGALRASVGVAGRREEFARGSYSYQRTVTSAYAELFVPLVGAANARSGVRRLELSLAGRFDDYGDVGSSTDPKVGLLWSPSSAFDVRTSFAKSFRVATLSQLAPTRLYQAYPYTDPEAPDGTTVSLYPADVSNSNLRPERSRSFSAGFDLHPAALRGFTAAVTYFDIDYRDRIQTPIAMLGTIYQHRDLYASFIDMNPDPAMIASILANYPIDAPAGLIHSAADVEAFLSINLQNLARTRTSGIDLQTSYDLPAPRGTVHLFLNGSYFLRSDFQTISTAPVGSSINDVFLPMDLRLRGGVSWSSGPFTAGVNLSYSDGYPNLTVAPAREVPSWTTADVQISYRTPGDGAGFLSGVSLLLDVQNITDRDPPAVPLTSDFWNFGYDPANASPLGRFASLTLRKRW